MAAGSLDFRLNLLANTTGLQQGMNGAKFAVNALVAAMAAVGVGLSVQGLAQAADSYTNLSARINIATRDGGNFNQAMAGVHQVALATNSSLEATGSLFTRLNTVGKEMGMTQEQTLALTRTVTQAIQVGGGSAQASEAAVQQFIQAMQGGVLRGEEFNSIMENGFGLAEALAGGLNVTTGELRKMAENGELSSERVVKAISSQAASIQATYDQFPLTIGNALQKITTSWEILIGKMDQSNGASAAVAQWLSLLADNISSLDVVLEDVGEGFVWVGDQLKKIDPASIEALKTALMTAYETLKELGSTVGIAFEAVVDVINTVLGQLFSFGSAVDTADDQTNGFTKTLQVINIAIGALNDGFSAIGIGVNLFVGALYSAASAWANLVSKFTWGDVKEEAIASMTAMQAKSEEYYQKASDGAINFKSKTVEALNEIGKTQQQKDADAVASSKAKLDQLLADQKTEADGKKVTEDQKLQAVQAFAEASITANKGVMDGTMQADLIAKGYIATLDGAGKVIVSSMTEAKKATEENAKANELAIENAKKAEADYLAFLKLSAVEKITLAKQIEDAKKSGDLNALLSAQTSLAAINAKEAELNEARKARNAEVALGIQGSADKARKSATALGVDLDQALGRTSQKFNETKVHLTTLANNLDALGAKGAQATNILYEGWVKWLEGAKNQVEIDAAKAKLNEFEKQGVFSTKQVEMGMQAIRQVTLQLPADIDPVTAAFERLGIKTKEQLALAAQSALADFNTIQASGQATSQSLKEAYERTMQAAAASGDQAVISATQAKAASLGLNVTIDETGKASVKSYNDVAKSVDGVGKSLSNIESGARSAGAVMREEALSSTEAWAKALEAQTGGMHATPTGTKTRLAFTQDEVVQQLIDMGFDEKQANTNAKKIIDGSKSGDGYRNASKSWLAANGFDVVGSFSGGGGGTSNTNYIREQLERYSQYAGNSTSTISSGTSKTVKYELSTANNTATVYGDEASGNDIESLFTELETLKRSG